MNWSREFFRHNFIYLAGSILVGILNYLFHPVLSRLLPISSFGELEALLAIFLQISIILTAFETVVINIFSNAETAVTHGKAVAELAKIRTINYYLLGSIVVVMLIFNKSLRSAFNFSSVYTFFILAAAVLSSIHLVFLRAYLQGVRKFFSVSLANVIISAGRLVFALVLVLAGFGAVGAMAGLVLANACAFIYLHRKTKHSLVAIVPAAESDTEPDKIFGSDNSSAPYDFSVPDNSGNLLYALLIILTLGFITFMYSGDIIVVKRFFDPETAGLYSGIATIARIIYFVTAPIAIVMFSYIKINDHQAQNAKFLFAAVALTVLIGGIAMTVFALFPEIVVKILIGSKYLNFAAFMPKLGLVLFLVALINIGFSYFLAKRNYRLMAIALLGIFLIIYRNLADHSSVVAVINNFLVVSLATATLVVGLYIYEHIKERAGFS